MQTQTESLCAALQEQVCICISWNICRSSTRFQKLVFFSFLLKYYLEW